VFGHPREGLGVSRVTAGVLAGIVLGLLHGFLTAGGYTDAAGISANLLGRMSQGIINGILAAYANKGGAPWWRGALWGALIGLLLGFLAGLQANAVRDALLPSALVGLGCGLATAKAKRP
jgi:hypothetical protein